METSPVHSCYANSLLAKDYYLIAEVCAPQDSSLSGSSLFLPLGMFTETLCSLVSLSRGAAACSCFGGRSIL